MRISIGFILSFLFLLHTTNAAIIEVGENKKFNSLNAAIQEANSFDSIYVHAGVYNENLIEVNKPLYLKGIDYPVFDANNGDEILVISSDSVTVTGFCLKNIGVSYIKDRAAIRLKNVQYVQITNNKLHNTFFGIYLQDTKNCVVKGNEIIGKEKQESSAGNAIHIWKSERILVLDNLVSQHRDGIYFEFVNHSYIKGNVSKDNIRYGMHFMFSNDDLYEENRFKNNGAGVAVMFSKNIEMIYNVFEENWSRASYGILLKEISDGIIRKNIFYHNTIGVYAEGANRIDIDQNEFRSNGKAFDIQGNCLDIVVTENNFINNTFEVLTNSKSNPNHFESNYWSQYQGYDLNKDGIGDVPYRPVNLFAIITQNIPAANMLLHSFLIRSLDMLERLFPQFIPESLIDNKPLMKPLENDLDRKTE